MNTNPQDFLIFVKSIPKEIIENIWFFPIWANSKKPEAKTELKNNENLRLTASQSYQRLKNGSNVGIYGLSGGLMFLDLDVSKGKLLASQSLLDALELNPTLTIKSRNGGVQYYFLNDGKYANQLLKENNVIIGELRTNWQYVVSVGSYVIPDVNCRGEPDGTYRIQKKCPISQFQPISCIDEIAVFDDSKKSKTTKAAKKIWNNDSVQAERISLVEYEKLMRNKLRR